MSRQIAIFTLGKTILGLDILLVREVFRGGVVTPVSDAPKQICGVMNLRGKVVTIMDLGVCLGAESITPTALKYLLILKTDDEIKKCSDRKREDVAMLGDDIVGFPIDQMDDVVEVEEEEIFPPPANLIDVSNELVEGIIKKGDNLVILIKVNRVLENILKTAKEANSIN